ncbi:MAG TPA: 30S ribosomal protein S12 methylthiotransferase RimO [Flavobacteriales bacterium]|jgi:ribosomal protein S12 methylthiotransferase|nr:30S ribosomal protein S12 methylthiotransferase RimO [Flavobacteriales bacterium]|tara:strand:+ start:772 stop:2085 length:1314 start_codon:yes stop_codon:yes gene_type:complete
MRTRTTSPRKVNVVTLGCAKNIFDSEVLMTQLRANAYEVEHESTKGDAGIVIINTCGFIESAKQESIDTIIRFSEAKQEGLVDRVYVTGCLSERYKEELSDGIPEVDAWFGTRDLPRLLKTLKADYKKELVGERLLTTPAHYAYMKIAEGCDRPCAFCAIPLMRGKHVSTPMEDIVLQAKGLAANGVRELILIAQDLTYYGLDIYKERKLAELVRRLSDVEGIDWIRLHYAFPTGFPLDVLDVMAERSNVCNYLDMPLQHASDEMLKAMRRGTTQEKMDRLIGEIRNRVPEIAIRTTLICGFPGETEAHHEDLMRWTERHQFERLGCFTYSHEENTHAYSMNDDVSEDVKRKRVEAIMEQQAGISHQLNQKYIGTTQRVLVDRTEDGLWIGRTEFDSPDVDNEVRIQVPEDVHLRIGDFASARIDSATEFDLHGQLV